MTRPLDLFFPSRRRFLIGSATTTLSAAAVALLAGHPTLAAAKGETHGTAASDAGTLNTALALEHEGINAYTLGAQSNLLQKPVLALAVKFQDDHKAHRDRLIKVIRTLGATPVEEKSLAEYAKDLEVDKLKSQADVLNFAASLEDEAVNAYLGIIPAFHDRQLAHLAGQLATDETEHFTLLSNALGRPLPAPFSFGA
jgi:rubrerythrin